MSFETQSLGIHDHSQQVLRSASRDRQVLFLHGAGGGGQVMPFMERLAEQVEVIAPVHPGFGGASQIPWLMDIEDLALFYLDFVDRTFERPVHVVGNSIGGWLAAEMAIRNGARIASLTLVGAAGLWLADKPPFDIFMIDHPGLVRRSIHDEALGEVLSARARDEVGDDRVIHNQIATARYAWEPRLHNPRLRKWLHRITAPTLVTWGAQDHIIPPDHGREYARLIGGASSHVFEACGHLPHVEKPDEFARLVLDFIGGIKS